MDKNTYNILLPFVNRREDIPKPKFSINKLFQIDGIEVYAKICTNEIAQVNYIDGKHVCIDYSDFSDILIDYVGLMKCMWILDKYIKEKTMNAFQETVYLHSDITRLRNTILRQLRGGTKKDVKKSIKDIEKIQEQDSEYLKDLFEAELRARSITNVVRNKGGNFVLNRYVDFKYWKMFRMMKEISKNVDNTIEEHLPIYRKRDWVIYNDALETFIDSHDNYYDVKSLSHDDLKKFIYLLVNCIFESKKLKYEPNYDLEILLVMEAIGYLTPNELMQIFPVRKSFDGDRFETKDYFFTMQRIEKHGINNPISNNEKRSVMDFLWDYDNDKLSIVLVEYMNIIESKYVSTGGKSFLDTFFN